MELDIRSKAYFGSTKSAAGQGTFADTEEDARKANAFHVLISYRRSKEPCNDQGRSSMESSLSAFDAIGAAVDVKLPAESGRSEMHAGLIVEEGEGKYKLTKGRHDYHAEICCQE